jgi:ribulose-phosphate 3-epimerase
MINMKIIPAILETDIVKIQDKLDRLVQFGSELNLVQLDVTDGTLTQQASWCDPLDLFRLVWTGEFELHLMQANPSLHQWLTDARVTRCIVHAEANNPGQLLEEIRTRGRLAGLAFSPDTDVQEFSQLINQADYIVLLTVTPGAQGQPFQDKSLLKIPFIKLIKSDLPIYADGGVNVRTMEQIISHGCDGVAVGSYLWNSNDIGRAIVELQR